MNRTCKHCGSEAIIMLTSTDEKLCADCKQYTPNSLKPGQQSVFIHNKVGHIDRILAEKTGTAQDGH